MTPLRTRLAAAAVGVGLVVAAPAAAWAGPFRSTSTTPTTGSTSPATPSDSSRLGIEALRAKCLAAIDVRLPALAAAKADVTANQHLTADHKAALTTDIDETTARLQTLADEIKADTDLATLEAVLLVADEPLPSRRLAQATGLSDAAAARRLLKKLQSLYDQDKPTKEFLEWANLPEEKRSDKPPPLNT